MFIPVLLMGGVVGRIFNEFAVVVTIAIVASAFVSLTLTPMLAARLPARHGHGAAAARRTCSSAASTAVLAGYRVLLDLCLRFRFADVPGVPRLGRARRSSMFATIPKGFFPPEDIGQLSVSTEARQDISFEAMVDLQREAAEILRALAACRPCRASRVGSTADRPARMNAGPLLRRAEAEGPARRRCRRCSPTCGAQLGQVPGISSFITPVQNLRIGGRSVEEPVPVRRAGPRPGRARRVGACGWPTPWAATARFTDVTSDLQNNALQATLSIDRDKARALGISADAAALDALHAASARGSLDHLRDRRQLRR